MRLAFWNIRDRFPIRLIRGESITDCIVGDLSKHIEEDGDVRYGSTYYSYLPDELVNAYGFYDVHGVVEMNKNIAGYSSLVTANDGGISFAHLAKEIRKDPSAVFKD